MTESVDGPSGPGTVVLELGADVGALVLFTPAELDGREIEISRDSDAGPSARRTHSQVRPRHMPAGTRYAAVYPQLAAGTYTIWADSQSRAGAVVIAGGRVTNWSWRSYGACGTHAPVDGGRGTHAPNPRHPVTHPELTPSTPAPPARPARPAPRRP